MKRVALFFTTLHRGGTEQQAMLLARHARKRQSTLFAYALADGPLHDELDRLGIPVRIFSTQGLDKIRIIGAVRRALRKDRIDVLHCLLWHPNIIGRLACRGTTTRCVNSIRWAELLPRDALDFATRWCVDAWIANSAWGARTAHLPSAKTTIIANGLDERLLKTSLSAWKPRPKTAIMVGRFRREKQYETLIRAAAQLKDWQFTLVGDGEMLDAMRSLAQSTGATNVTFSGKQEPQTVHKLMLHHQVSLLLSDHEGNPNVTIESLALGVPFVGTDIEAHRTIVGSDRGIIVPGRSPAALIRALRRCATRSSRQTQAMRRAGQRYVREHYSIPRMVDATEQVWSRVSS